MVVAVSAQVAERVREPVKDHGPFHRRPRWRGVSWSWRRTEHLSEMPGLLAVRPPLIAKSARLLAIGRVHALDPPGPGLEIVGDLGQASGSS